MKHFLAFLLLFVMVFRVSSMEGTSLLESPGAFLSVPCAHELNSAHSEKGIFDARARHDSPPQRGAGVGKFISSDPERDPYAVELVGDRWVARNPHLGVTFELSEGGVAVRHSTNQISDLGLRLTRFGYSEAMRKAPPIEDVVTEGNRLEYHRGDLTEWYENTPAGLEQGFTLERPPTGRGKGNRMLGFEIAFTSSLRAVPETSGASVRLLDPDGREVFLYEKLVATDAVGRVLSARMELLGAHSVALVVDDHGASYPLLIDPLLTPQTVKLTSSSGIKNGGFGKSVAVFEDTLAVGAFGYSFGNSDTGQSAAYVFKRTGGGWVQEARLTASDTVEADFFGTSAAVSGDTVVVGSFGHAVGGNTGQGAAYIFRRIGETWILQSKLTAGDGGANDGFGGSVAISGNTVIVGSFRDDVGTSSDQGSVYVFVRNGETWTEQAKLISSSGGSDDLFGFSVAISGDTIAATALNERSVFVFSRNGTTWTQDTTLVSGSLLGRSVAIDGDTVVAGAPTDLGDRGAAFVFTRSGSTWSEQAKLIASDRSFADHFGSSVGVFGDAVVVGSILRNTGGQSNQGAAYVFTRRGTAWTEQSILSAQDGASDDRFGNSVAISADTVAVGTAQADIDGNYDQGAVYVFDHFFVNGAPDGTDGTVRITGASPHPFQVSDFGFSDPSDNPPNSFNRVKVSTLPESGTLKIDDTVVSAGDFITTAELDAQRFTYTPPPTETGNLYTTFSFQVEDNGGTANGGINLDPDPDTIALRSPNQAPSGSDNSISIEEDSIHTFAQGEFGLTDPNDNPPNLFNRVKISARPTAGTLMLDGGTVGDDDYLAVSDIIAGKMTFVPSPNGNGSPYATFTFQVEDDGGTASGGLNLDPTPNTITFNVTEVNDVPIVTGSSIQLVQLARLIAGDGAGGDQFSSGGVDMDGDTVVVGATFDDVNNNIDEGSAYVFIRDETSLRFQAKLTQPEGEGSSKDHFGVVALSGDTLAVGARSHDSDASKKNSGAVYIFSRSGAVWARQAKLSADDGLANDGFGSVAIDGDTLIVGAAGADIAGNSNQGAAYVFTRSGSSWSLRAKLTASDGASDDRFGGVVAIDGDTVLIGASGAKLTEPSDSGHDHGAAYVFTRTGAEWSQQAKLIASDRRSSQYFGGSADIGGDTVIIGADGLLRGAAYVFIRQESAWIEHAKLSPSRAVGGARFGSDVAISGDLLIVGARGDTVGTNQEQGSVFLFAHSGTTWTERAKLTASDGEAGDLFGTPVAIQGNTIIAGARSDDVGGHVDQGSVFAFVTETTNTLPGLVTIDEDATRTFGTSHDDLISVEDVDAGESPIQVTLSVDSGTLNLGETFGLSFNFSDQYGAGFGDGQDDPVMTFRGTLQSLNNALDGLAYTPTANYEGLDTVKITVNDLGSSGIGGALAKTETIDVTVKSVNDPPAGADHTISISEDSTYTFRVSDFGFSDLEDNPPDDFERVRFTTVPDNGILKIGGIDVSPGDEVWAININRNSLTFEPELHENGTSYTTFTFQVRDNGNVGISGVDLDPDPNTITINVSSENDAPLNLPPFRILPSDGMAEDRFGQSVAIDGDTAVVGARLHDVNGSQDQGSAYVYVRSGRTWIEQARLTANNGEAFDSFGSVVAIDGDTVVVGSYVFGRNGAEWTQLAELTVGGIRVSMTSLAILEETIAVGSGGDRVGSNSGQGSVYVFVRDGTSWISQARLFAGDGAHSDRFGSSVALSGTTLVVGADRRDEDANRDQGAVYVFTKRGTTWFQQTKLTASDGSDGDLFGSSVAISGNSIVVGASQHHVGNNGLQGSAYVFTQTGPDWSQQAQLIADDGAFSDYFGTSVAILGGTVAIGAPGRSSGQDSDGAVYLFERTGTVWSQYSKLTIREGERFEELGHSVALSDKFMLSGASWSVHLSGVSTPGSAHVFLVGAETDQATTKVFSSAEGNAISVTDVDAGNEIIQVAVSVEHGILNLNGTEGLDFNFNDSSGTGTGDGREDANLVFRGNLTDIHNALSSLAYSPTPEFRGRDMLSINSNDLGNSGNGGALTDTATLMILVTNVPHAPAGQDNSIVLDEDDTYTFAVEDFGFIDPSDSPADSFSRVKISKLPENGVLKLAGSPVGAGDFVAVAEINADRLTFHPIANENGSPYTSFTVQVEDDGGTDNGRVNLDPTPNEITFNVAPANDAPVVTIESSEVETDEDRELVFSDTSSGRISITDIDAGSNSLKVWLSVFHGVLYLGSTSGLDYEIGSARSGNPIVYFTGDLQSINTALNGLKFRPSQDFNGFDELTVICSDLGNSGVGGARYSSATIPIRILSVNDRPSLSSSPSPVLDSIRRDAPAPAGPVGTLIGGGFFDEWTQSVTGLIDFEGPDTNVSDSDIETQFGIAVTSVSEGGNWYFSTNDGPDWSTLGPVSESSARLLAADGNTRIYFQPASGLAGLVFPALTFRAWDQTSGINGSLADTSGAGFSWASAFSVSTDFASIVVTSPDDAPLPSISPPLLTTERIKVVAGEFSYNSPESKISISGNSLAVFARLGVFSEPVVAIFERIGNGWLQQTNLLYSGGDSRDNFGSSMSIDGDTVVVGVSQDDIDGKSDQGSAYVFARSGDIWRHEAILTASDGAAGDAFGSAVAVSGDTLVVCTDLAGDYRGAAYVFTRNGASWIQQEKLTAGDAAPRGIRFGSSVAASGDTVIVGAQYDPIGQGSAYVFTRFGSAWAEQAKLTETSAQDFGRTVAISADTVVIGAPGGEPSASRVGSAYVYSRNGTTWSRESKLQTSDVILAPGGTKFGFSVAISGDAIVVGERFYRSSSNPTDQGAAYLFMRIGQEWTQRAGFLPDAPWQGDEFGFSLGITGDTLAFSHLDRNGPDGNSAILYTINLRNAPAGSDGTIVLSEDATAAIDESDFGFTNLPEGGSVGFARVRISTLPALGVLNRNGITIEAGAVVDLSELAARQLTYTPAPNGNGYRYASFTFQVEDDGGTADGRLNLDPSPNTIWFDVLELNDPPTGTDNSVTVAANSAYPFQLHDFGFGDPLDNPPNSLAGVRTETLPNSGTLRNKGTVLSEGNFVPFADLTENGLVFSPAPHETGSPYASFEFRVQDDGGNGDGEAQLDPGSNAMTINVREDDTSAPIGLTGAFPMYAFSTFRNAVVKIEEDGRLSTFATGFHNPIAMAFGPDGSLYVANTDEFSSISRVFPDGKVNVFAAGLGRTRGLVFDSAGNLYVANSSATSRPDTISMITPSGTISDFAFIKNPGPMAFDSHGNLFVGSSGTFKILKVAPNGAVSPFSEFSRTPSALVVDAADRLYVVNWNYLGSWVFRITGAGSISEFASLPSRILEYSWYSPKATSLSIDSFGNLYVGNSPGGTFQNWVEKLTPNGTISMVASGAFGVTDLELQVPVITSENAVSGTTGAPFAYTITGDYVPTSFSAPGLPKSLSIDTATGLISGRPTESGSFPVAVSATGTAGTAKSILTLTFNPLLSGMETTPLSYIENAPATPITSTLVVSESENVPLTNAKIEIIQNYRLPEDAIKFSSSHGISGVFDSALGTMELTGTALPAEYQAALRSVTYRNTSDHPNGLMRTVRFTIGNDEGLMATAARMISVTPVNDPPDGADNSILLGEDGIHVFSVADFGFSDSNDSPENNFVRVRISTETGVGTLKLNDSVVTAGDFVAVTDVDAGSFSFVHVPEQNGPLSTSFTFQVEDDGGTANGGISLDTSASAVTITLREENHVPTITSVATQVVDEDSGATTVDLLGITSGLGDQQQVLAVTPASDDPDLVHVTAVDYASPHSIGSLTFVPVDDAFGTTTITVTVSDDDHYGFGTGLSASTAFTVEVEPINDAPIIMAPAFMEATEDVAFLFAEDSAISVSDVDVGVVAESSDLGPGRVVRAINVPGWLGSVVVVPIEFAADGNENAVGFSLEFEPAVLSFTGATLGTDATAAFLSVVSGQAGQGRVGLTAVLPVGQAFPSGANRIVECNFSVTSESELTHTVVGFGNTPVLRQVKDVLGDSTQADFEPGTVTLNSAVAVSLSVNSGSLTLSGSSGLNFTVGDGEDDPTMDFTGDLETVNGALAGLAYRGAPNFNGSDVLQMEVDDLGNTGSGGVLEAIVTIPITVTPVSDPPEITAHPEDTTIVEGSDVTLSVSAIGIPPLSYQWRRNDEEVLGATNSSLTLNGVTASEAGAYTVVVSNDEGAVTSESADLTVLVVPVVPLRYLVGSSEGVTGSQVVLPVRVDGFTDVVGFQFSMHWNPDVVNFRGVERFGLAGLTSGSFGTLDAAVGALRVSWDDATSAGRTLLDGAAIFDLRFEIIGNVDEVSTVTIDGTPIALESSAVMEGGINDVLVEVESGEITVRSGLHLTGKILYYSEAAGVPGVGLFAGDQEVQEAVSGPDGVFSITADSEVSFTLRPARPVERFPSQGVTTLDLALMRRHILALEKFDSPFRILAADVNNSSSVTTFDIALIRRVILGISETLPNGFWEFVRSDYEFNAPTAPWEFEDYRTYVGLSEDVLDQDFIAVKNGDVNASWTPPGGIAGASASLVPLEDGPAIRHEFSFSKEAKSSEARIPRLTSETLARPDVRGDVEIQIGVVDRVGQLISIPVTVSEVFGLTSAQFTMEWDPTVLGFAGVGDFGLEGLGVDNFGWQHESPGRMSFSWDDPHGVGVATEEDGELFRLSFERVGPKRGGLRVWFGDVPAQREITVNMQRAEVRTEGRWVVLDRIPAMSPPRRIVDASGESILLSGPTVIVRD